MTETSTIKFKDLFFSLKKAIYIFILKIGSGRVVGKMEKEILYPLVHTPNGGKQPELNSWKPRAWSSI